MPSTLHHFPAVLWERILAFLPDQAVATSCQVCRAWHNEIWAHSSNLWRQLLQRRNWPLPSEGLNCRDEFIKHYTVCRRVETVMAMECEPAVCVLPSTNSTRSLRVWSKNHILVIARSSCSLQLYCKGELVVSYDDIYQDVSDHVAGFGAQKNESSILSADLDDESLACLFHAGWLAERDNGDSYFGDAYVLILWSRAGFLAAEKPILIDIVSDVTVYARERFVPRLSQENLLSLQISVSSTIVACGRSRFLLEAAISLDLEGDDYETLGRQLVLYSANGLLLWRGNSNLDGIHLVPAHEEMLLASSCEGDTSAFLLASQHTVILGEINSDNALEGKTSLVPPECPDQRWSLTCKSLAITSAHTVVAYIAILKVNDLVLKEKVLVSFYPRPAAAVADYTGELQNTIELAGVEKVLQILGFGTEHVLIVGQSSLSVGPTGGHWSRNEDPSELITMHIFHTTSQCQIGCVHLKVAKASVPTFASQGETLVRSHNCTARSPNRNMY